MKKVEYFDSMDSVYIVNPMINHVSINTHTHRQWTVDILNNGGPAL